MTRKSQEIYDHRIDQGSVANGIRFSLTFRSISRLNRNATCIVGDSNTAGLKFGSDPKHSFGKSLPGTFLQEIFTWGFLHVLAVIRLSEPLSCV